MELLTFAGWNHR